MRCFFIIIVVLQSVAVDAQQDFMELNGGFKGELYTYTHYLNDKLYAQKMYAALEKNNYDTLAKYLPRYKNRLGYEYYVFMAGLLKMENDPYAYAYLDTAFQRGLAPACVTNYLKGFKEQELQKHFLANTMKAFDAGLIRQLDSLQRQDQLYRLQVRNLLGIGLNGTTDLSNDIPSRTAIQKYAPDKLAVIDTLMRKQQAIDFSSSKFILSMTKNNGFPTATKIGTSYCYKKAIDPYQMVMRTLTQFNNTTSLFTLPKYISKFCLYQEEDWSRVEQMLKAFFAAPTEAYRTFSFLKISDNQVDKFESALALNQMAEAMVLRGDCKLEIRGSNNAVLQSLKERLLYHAKYVVLPESPWYANTKFEIKPRWPEEKDIVAIPNSSLPPNVVEFRFVYWQE